MTRKIVRSSFFGAEIAQYWLKVYMCKSSQNHYLCSNGGFIKLAQIIFGLVICVLISDYTSGKYLGDHYKDFIVFVNFGIFIGNIIFLFLNIFDYRFIKIERLYSVICTALLFTSTLICAWWWVLDFLSKFDLNWTILSFLFAFYFVLFLVDTAFFKPKDEKEYEAVSP